MKPRRRGGQAPEGPSSFGGRADGFERVSKYWCLSVLVVGFVQLHGVLRGRDERINLVAVWCIQAILVGNSLSSVFELSSAS